MTRKVLVLHGYAQNAIMFSKRLASFLRECGDDIELVFVDAPHTLNPVDIVDVFSPGKIAEPFSASANAKDPSLTPRGWWYKADAARADNGGLEASISRLRDVLVRDHFVGVFGFSQGAVMAVVLSALLERPYSYPEILMDGRPPHPKFQFCVAVSGFKPSGNICTTLFATSYKTPNLHILGRNDVVVIEEKSKTLLDVSGDKRVEWHDGGHFVPTQPRWRTFMREYLNDPRANIASPGFIYPAELDADYHQLLVRRHLLQSFREHRDSRITRELILMNPYLPTPIHSPLIAAC